jgi:3-isopropylmalate dehydratase small subunit
VNEKILRALMDNSGEKLTINVEKSEIRASTKKIIKYEIDTFSKYCLVEGINQLDIFKDIQTKLKNLRN